MAPVPSQSKQPWKPLPPQSIHRLRLAAGVLFLVAGSLEYVFGRPLGSAAFLSPFYGLLAELPARPNLFGPLGPVAPDFFHPLAFALISMALVADRLRNRLAVCLAWLGIDAALELAQGLNPHLSPQAAAIPLAGDIAALATGGRFDARDLLAIVLGTAVAFLIGHLTKKEAKDATPN